MIEIRSGDENLAKLLPPAEPRPDLLYRPSQYSISFDCDGKSYVFNTLTKQCVESKLPSSARAGEGYDDLIRAMFLVPEKKDECAFYQSVFSLMQIYHQQKDFSGYVILPTTGCNARCVYCYEKNLKPVSMPPEIAEQTVRFIIRTHQGEEASLSWFGGEPLLYTDIIDRIYRGLRDAGVPYKSSMVTNASLITPEIVEKMKGDWRFTTVQVSMDGAEADYIARKRYPVYRDYYHSVIDAVNRMAEAGISVHVRCNVDLENWAGIPQFVEDLRAGIAKKEKVLLYLTPLYGTRKNDEGLSLMKRIKDVDEQIREAGFKKTTVIGVGKELRFSHCLATSGGIVIHPDGSLYLCEHFLEKSRVGDIWRGVTDQAARTEFCRMDRIREKCRSCPFLPYCTGFSSCPIQDVNCRENYSMGVMESLQKLVRNQTADTDVAVSDC